MKPNGKLEDVPIFEVLKFCEQNSLTGCLNINNETNHAELNFNKGQLQEVKYNKLIDDQAMDEILTWEKGSFQIEPSILHIEGEEKEKQTEEEEISDDPLKAMEYFSIQLINKLITVVGSRSIEQLLSKTRDSLIPFFPNLNDLIIKITETDQIFILESDEIKDKDILSIGVFMQSLIEKCKAITIGMSFLNLQSLAGPYFEVLEKNSFFEYMSHAKEFVNQ